MDRIRSLLLARTHVVVMDPDLVSQAATRPVRDVDVDKLEDELVRLGFVLSLDLAMTLRRLPHQSLQGLRKWIVDTLASSLRGRPELPAADGFAQRMQAWLATVGEQPCPWCSETKDVGALDPCGHLVCSTCWSSGSFAGCPICHRRIAPATPFLKPATEVVRVRGHLGQLGLLHLGTDLVGLARTRFERLLARPTPLSRSDREELETIIDSIGPRTATWLPARIPVRATMAIALARLWLISPQRAAMARETSGHLRSATDVLRVAAVLMGGNAELVEPMRFGGLARGLRRCVLEALDGLPLEESIEDMMRHRRAWLRAGERLHPFELAPKLPNATLAFAALRGTNLATASFGETLRERANRMPFVYIADDTIKSIAWAGPIEDALRAGNPRSALARLTHRADELLRRADHLVRLAQTRQLDALQTLLKAVELAAVKGSPERLLALASHVARRQRPWPRRVFLPHGDALDAWGTPDTRVTLRGDAIAVVVGSIRRHLVARAETRRAFPRAVIDRALVDVGVPVRERPIARAKQTWPRGSELGVPEGTLRLSLHCDAELDIAVELFDAGWRHMARREPLEGRVVELQLEQLQMLGARHALMVIASKRALAFDRLPVAFVGIESDGTRRRFDLRGRSELCVPLAIDTSERRLRWLDVFLPDRAVVQAAGGYRAALAHLGRDFTDLIITHARPTMWDLACIHAAGRANTIYVRERDGAFTIYRRRDNESKLARLGRLMSGAADDGRIPQIPTADAPTWFALVSGMPLPKGSAGFALDGRELGSDLIQRMSATDLVAELAPK